MGVQIEKEMRAIQAMQIVTKLWVSVRKSDRYGCRVSLTCFSCKEHAMMTAVERNKSHQFQVSSRHPTLLACLQELRKRLDDHHVGCAEALAKKTAADTQSPAAVSQDTPNVLQAMM